MPTTCSTIWIFSTDHQRRGTGFSCSWCINNWHSKLILWSFRKIFHWIFQCWKREDMFESFLMHQITERMKWLLHLKVRDKTLKIKCFVPSMSSLMEFKATHWFVSFFRFSSWQPKILVPTSFSGGVHSRLMQFLKALTILGGAGRPGSTALHSSISLLVKMRWDQFT